MHINLIKIFKAIIFLCMFGTSAMSQTYVTLSPMLGLKRCFSKFESGDKPDFFKNNAANKQICLGVMLDFHKNKFTYSAGYMYNHAGYAYSLRAQEGHPRDSGYWSYKHSSANQGWSIPLRVTYSVFQTKGNFINFKLNTFAGFSIDHFSPSPDSIAMYSNAHIETKSTYKTIHQYGMSANVGVTFQFLHRRKESIALTLFYNQGFTKYESIRLNYTTLADGASYQCNLISRATSLGFIVSYPIKIWDAEKRKAKKLIGGN